MSERRSRRTRGERPELIPPKSDEEPDLDDNYVDENGNNIAVGAIRGRRRGKRGRNKETGSITAKSSSSSLSQLDTKKPLQPEKLSKKPSKVAPATKKRSRRGRPLLQRSRSPSPSQSSLSMSACLSMDEDEDDEEDDGYTMESFEFADSNVSNNDSNNEDEDEDEDDEDDAERDTEDDAPKEALTGKKKAQKKQTKKQQGKEEVHPRYKNVVKVACRHCGKLCFSQGIKIHERHCMPVYTPREDTKKAGSKVKAKKYSRRKRPDRRGSNSTISDSRRSSGTSSDSSDSSSPPSPVVIVRKKIVPPKKQTAVQPKDKGSSSTTTDPVKPYICRNCGKFFTPRGINAHEKRCMPVYAERTSSEPDVKPKLNKEKETSDSESKEARSKPPRSRKPGRSEPASIVARSSTRGGSTSTRDSARKKKEQNPRVRNKKNTLEKDQGEPKTRKRRAAAIAASTDDDTLLEDDVSSAAKPNVKTADDTKTEAGEGEIAGSNTIKNSKDPPVELIIAPKRQRRKKQSETKEEEEGVGPNVESKVVDGETSSGENESTSARKPKTETAVVEKLAQKDAAKAKGSQDGASTTACASSTTTTNAKNQSGSNAAKKGEKKKGAKNSKTFTTLKGKITPITEFVTAIASPSKQLIKTPAPRADGKAKNSNESNNEGDSAVIKQQGASPSTKGQSSARGTTKTGNKIVERKSSDKIGEDEERKNTKSVDSVSKTASAAKKDGINSPERDEKVPPTASKAEQNTVKSAETDQVTKEEPDSIKTTYKDSAIKEGSVMPIGRENDKRKNVSGEIDQKNGPVNSDVEKTAARKLLEKKERTKVAASTRPTRKRKLTPKAAEAAAIIAIKNEEKKIAKTESDIADGSSQAIEKKQKTENESEPPSDVLLSKEQTKKHLAAPDATHSIPAPMKDQKGKASIVEAAKNAAAATLAALSLFTSKPKSVEGTISAQATKESVQSIPKTVSVEKPMDNMTIRTSPTSKKAEDNDETAKILEEVRLVDVKPAKPAEAVPANTNSIIAKQDDAVSSVAEEAQGVLKNITDQTTHVATTISDSKSGEKQRILSNLSIRESPTTIQSEVPCKKAAVTKPAVQISSTSETENEKVENTNLVLGSKEGTAIEKPIETVETNATKGDSLLLTKENAVRSENSREDKETQQNEKTLSIPKTNSDAASPTKIDSISVRQESSPVTSEETNEGVSTIDPEKMRSSGRDVSNRVESQENISATEELTTSIDGSHGRTAIDQGNEKHKMDLHQSDVTEKSVIETVIKIAIETATETATEMTGARESEENDGAQLPPKVFETEEPGLAESMHPKTSMDQPHPKTPIVTEDDIIRKGNCESVQKQQEVLTPGKETHGGSEGVRDETSVAAKGKESVEGHDEIESSQVQEPGPSKESKEETVLGVSSADLGDCSQDVENTSEEIMNDDTKDSTDDIAKAEVDIQQTILESAPVFAKSLKNTEEKKSEESPTTMLQVAIEKSEEAIEEKIGESKHEIISSINPLESVPDSMESEKKSNAETPINTSTLSEHVVSADLPSNLAKAADMEQDLSLPANTPNHAQNTTTTVSNAPKFGAVLENADNPVSKVIETNSIDHQSTESGKDPSIDTIQLPEVSKSGNMNDEMIAVKAPHPGTLSHKEEATKSLVDSTEDIGVSSGEAGSSERPKKSFELSTAVSIPMKAESGNKEESSKVQEDISSPAPESTFAPDSTLCSNETVKGEHEDNTSKDTEKHNDDQDTKYNMRNVLKSEEVVTDDKDSQEKESDNVTVSVDVNENAMNNANATVTGNAAMEVNVEKSSESGVPNESENEHKEDKGEPSSEAINQVDNRGDDTYSVAVCKEDLPFLGETDLKIIPKKSAVSLIAHNELSQANITNQELNAELKENGDNNKEVLTPEKASSDAGSKTADNHDGPEYDKDDEANPNAKSQEILPGRTNEALAEIELKSPLETSDDGIKNLDNEKESTTLDVVTEVDKNNEVINTTSAKALKIADAKEAKLPIDSNQVEENDIMAKSMNLPLHKTISKVVAADAARKDVSAILNSLLNSVESRVNSRMTDSTPMDIATPHIPNTEVGNTCMEVDAPDNFVDSKEDSSVSSSCKPEETKSTDLQDAARPTVVISSDGVNSSSEIDDSTMALEVAKEGPMQPEEHDDVLRPKEEIEVAWVAMSKAPRQLRNAKFTSGFIGYDENKMDCVKWMLYTAGSKIHRGRGFERIFGMYWDAMCLRLSRPLNKNTSKYSDQAISVFLKTRKLRKIHNKFVISIMRQTMKNRVPYSDVSEHVPIKWQGRVKVPHVVTLRKVPKKKNKAFYDGLKDGLSDLTGVPHVDGATPYKERWEFPIDDNDESQETPQEGPSAPIASSCIPGALVVDPMIRETAEASGMKVADNAMWLLTVALKEHIKNVLNNSIEYKRGLKKGEIFPQAIRYPNVLATSSNKNRKISKGRNSGASLENGRKKRINSIDIFAALNMLPSGKPASIGGSISRMTLEQTFLSGFNSIPSFDTGNAFKDVQSFISNTILVMAKDRKPEEKKMKASHTKSGENQTSKSRHTKPASHQDNTKTPSPHPSRSKAPVSITSPPVPILDSPPLMHNLSPANVQTPVMDSPSPKIKISQLVSETQKDIDATKASSTTASQGTDIKASKVEKPAQKATAAVPPSQFGSLRAGAGRGAKNLAALMMRAAESNSQRDLSQGDEKCDQANAKAQSDATVKTEQKIPDLDNPNSQGNTQQSLQPNADPKKQTTGPSNNGASSKPEVSADATSTKTSEDAVSEDRFSIPPRQQPIAPVRRGKGKGFGSKDLAAMRARSMTSTDVEVADNSKPDNK